MKRILIASVAGGIVLFVWSFVSWMFVPWHMMQKLPEENRVREALRATDAASGIYVMPGIDHAAMKQAETREAAEQAWKEAHEAGPLALLVYRAEGGSPMPPLQLAMGLVLDIVLAAIAATLLSMAAPALPGFAARMGFVVIIGLYTAVGTHLVNWNWMHYPMRYTLEIAADTIVSAVLLGVVLALVIKPHATLGADDIEYELPAGV